MFISSKKIMKLSEDVKRLIAGEDIDIRDNKEGSLRILKNDIQSLANNKKEQVDILHKEQVILKNTLADISHQLKTPLTSMMIMAELLETASPKKQAEFISNIQSSLRRTEWLVSALLKMAKLEAKSITFKKEIIKSNDLIEKAIEPLRIQLELANQNVVIYGNMFLECDVKWTIEALTNILKNASEHGPKGSEIIIEVGENPIVKWISVRDFGPGLSRCDVAKIFKRFETTGNVNSYGIGLPLALMIMQNQFGDIDVDTGSKNTGAKFTLKFYRFQNKNL